MPNITRKIRVPPVSVYTSSKELSSYSKITDETNTAGYKDSNFPAAPDNIYYTVFEWESLSDFLSNLDVPDENTVIVESISLDLYYRYADNLPSDHTYYNPSVSSFVRSLDLKFGTGDLPSLAGTDELTYIAVNSSTQFDNITLRGDKKQRKQFLLNDSNSFYSSLQNELRNDGSFFIAIGYSTSDYDSNNQIVEIGGKTLKYGTNDEWTELEPYHSAELVLTIQLPTEDSSFTYFDLKYTTQDPTTPQNSPENSIGGYISSNSIFDYANVLGNFGTTDDSIDLNSGDTLPTNTSVPIQVGYELVSYKTTSEDQISTISREQNLSYGKFVCTNDYISQKISYLTPDNLFNNDPSENLTQYRCIFLQNLNPISVKKPKISLINPENSNTDIQIAVELPEFDYATGYLNADVTSGDTTFISGTSEFLLFETDHFKNCHVVFNRFTSPVHAFITGYTQNGSIATFTVDRNLPSLSSAGLVEIMSSPSQTVTNDQTNPDVTKISNFISHGETLNIVFNDKANNFVQYAGVYIWIKRTLLKNKKSKSNTGSIIKISYTL